MNRTYLSFQFSGSVWVQAILDGTVKPATGATLTLQSVLEIFFQITVLVPCLSHVVVVVVLSITAVTTRELERNSQKKRGVICKDVNVIIRFHQERVGYLCEESTFLQFLA